MSTQTEAKHRMQAHRVWLANQEAGPRPVTTPDELGARQRQVLALVAAGVTSREIAARLGIAPATVRNHLHAIYPRLPLTGGSNRRVQAALWYLRHRGER